MAQFISISGINIRTYGLIVILAILLGLGVSYFLASAEKKYREHLLNVVVYAAVGAIIGARIWQVFFYDWKFYSQNPGEIIKIWHGGMAIQGSIVGAIVVGIFYARIHKIDFWRLADIATPGLIIGQAVGRIACFLNGDAYGSPTNSGFGIVYPPGTPAYNAYGNQPLWPAEVWEGQWDMVIFFIVLILSHWRKWSKGTLFLIYLSLYALGRFILEFLRGDSPLYLFNFTAGQWSSVIMLFAIFLAYIYLKFRTSKENPEAT